MSDVRWFKREADRGWRNHPNLTAFWLTVWLMSATVTVRDIYTHSPGWWTILHLLGTFVITSAVVEMFAGKVRRR